MGRVTVEQLDVAAEAVYATDAAWMEALDSAPAKDAYKTAKAEYKALADAALDQGLLDTCGRCGGAGGWQGWPGFTCFQCGGNGRSPWKRIRFQAMPPTRAKQAAKWEAKAAVMRAEEAANWEKFSAEHPTEAAFLATQVVPEDEYADYDRFMCDLHEKARRWGSLSEKQVACVTREMAKREKAANATPFPSGAVTVSGTIVGRKETEGYGGRKNYNMLVELDGEHVGNTVMGSIPAKVYSATQDEEKRIAAPLEGTKLTFTATFERGREEHFGFFKSPKQVKVTYVAWPEVVA